ncbi:MAG: GH3 auxin-responsive promoter family protein [Leptolyngbya sp. IPPAS B-1204]|nr:MAG: GH3 auxin-responsive promoter [Leptolyngbya sp. IPPAS B-1204]
MANLVLPLVKAYATYAKANFVRKTRQPLQTQEQFLRQLLQVQQGTELGQEFGLGEIKTIDQFRDRVPILPYSSYEPYTDRVARGEPNVLNADPVLYINLTSGTTGKQKMVPVTHRFTASLGKANAAALGFLLEALSKHSVGRDRKLEFGRVVSANSVRLQGRTEAGIEYGPVTAGSFRMNRALLEQGFAQPFAAMEISESVSRHYVCLLFALTNPAVRGLTANFPMLVLRICGYLDKYADDLIQDIAAGTFANWLTIEPELRTQLERRWRPHPQRAVELRQILETKGRLTPKDAWPKLSTIGTAMGGTSDFYLKRFPEYFGDIPVFGGVYGTAEANFGVYHDLNTEGCILAIESGFYEFVPPDQWEVDQPKTLLPTEVKAGEFYRILLSSYSGFYRYDIGDVVEVLGFYENTPIIAFRHRRGGLLSSTTEKTTEYHVTQTMQTLQQEFGISLDDFCITLSEQEFPAHYLVNIELAAGQTLSDPLAFLQRFDYWLGEFNDQYRIVRKDPVPPPRLRLLAPGSFAIVRQRQLQRGTSDSQLKIPHLTEDRNFLKDLVVLQEVRLPGDGE